MCTSKNDVSCDVSAQREAYSGTVFGHQLWIWSKCQSTVKGNLGWKLLPYGSLYPDHGVLRWYLYVCKWFEYEVFGFQFKSPGCRHDYLMEMDLNWIWTGHIRPNYDLWTIGSTIHNFAVYALLYFNSIEPCNEIEICFQAFQEWTWRRAGNLKCNHNRSESPTFQNRRRIIDFRSLKEWSNNMNTDVWFGTRLIFSQDSIFLRLIIFRSQSSQSVDCMIREIFGIPF